MRFNHSLGSITGVSSGGPITINHRVSEGDYILDFASLIPDGPDFATWATVRFEQDPSTSDVTRTEFGAGYATEEIPFKVQGPIPFQGPGYFLLRVVSTSATDKFYANLAYRRVIS